MSVERALQGKTNNQRKKIPREGELGQKEEGFRKYMDILVETIMSYEIYIMFTFSINMFFSTISCILFYEVYAYHFAASKIKLSCD